MPPRWDLLAGPWNEGPAAKLTAATARRITARLGQPSDVAFTINGRHEQALGLVELVTDIWAYRDQRLLHRGRVGSTTDQVTPDTHTVTVNAPDYRSLLDRRIEYDSDKATYTQEDQAFIAWQLVQATQGRPGGNLGITRGIGQSTGYLRDRQRQAGKPTGESISQLSDVANGFDWEIDPQLRLNLYTPQRGRLTDVVLDYGMGAAGAVSGFSRTLAPAEFANAVRATAGADPRAPEYRTVPDIATRPEGRFELDQGFPDIRVQSALAGQADFLLADRQTPRPAIALTLRAGAYPGPDALWLGDTVTLALRSGRVQVAGPARVQEISFAVGEDGSESVAITCDRPDPAGQFAQRMRDVNGRLSVLERR